MPHFDATFEVEGLVFPPTSVYCQIGEWVYYNFAAGSFLSKIPCSRLHSIEVDLLTFIPKKEKFAFFANQWASFWGTLGRLTGNVHTSSIARWKARVQLPIHHNWTFSLALTAETLQAEICGRERFLKGVGQFDHPLKVEGDVVHQPLLGGRKLEGLPFHLV